MFFVKGGFTVTDTSVKRGKQNKSANLKNRSTGIKETLKKYFPFYKYGPKHIKRLDKRDVIAFGKMDTKFFLLVMILLVIGLVAMFSASYVNAINRHDDSYYYIRKQFIFAAVGIVAMFIVSRVNYKVYRDFSFAAIVAAFLFLVLVLKFHTGSGSGDDDDAFRRWFAIAGHAIFQPSELAKIALILYCAWSMERRKKQIASDWKVMFLYMAVIGSMCVLIMLEKHVSCTILVCLMGIATTYIGGIDRRWFPFAIACLVAVAVIVVIFRDQFGKISLLSHAMKRITAWLDKSYDPQGARWQTNQSLYAIGSGGLFGVGLGNSKQKHMYVSEPQNDFVFAIFCEEMGLVGALVVMVLFILLIKRAIEIGMRTKEIFPSLLVMGIAIQVGLQTIINIAVVTDLLPNTGIGLPFFSYGGTSLLILLAEMGMILSVSRSARIEKI